MDLKRYLLHEGERKRELSPHIRRILPEGRALSLPSDAPPVTVNEPTWLTVRDPERLVRRFKFDDSRRLRLFILGVLDVEEETGHNGTISIARDTVTVEVWTHSLEQITELDLEYANLIDEVFEDVKFYNVDS